MLNDSRVIASVDWLKRVQNAKDGGWGMYDHADSRIVTTAEAVSALAVAGAYGDHMERGIRYLAISAKDPTWCQYTRHHAWTIYALTRAGRADKIPPRCFRQLQRDHAGGAWNHEPRGAKSLFATFLAVRALAIANKSAVSIDQARQWIIHNSQKGFWTFTGGAAGYAATSYAILALTARSDWRELYAKPVQQGLDYLRTGADTAWPNEEEPRVSGDALYNFHHCSLPWAIMAFLAAGTSVFDPIIFKAMDRLYNALYCNNSGGWAEEENHRPGVFATSHAIAALDTFHRALSVEDLLGRYNNQLSAPAKAPQVSHDVFVAHGHDPAVKHQVARFVEQIGCKPIILDEQVDAGLNTIFQKLAQHADKVSYAIVLLTPDDLTQDRTGKQATRARQNAILELGYFIGKLGPENVCVAKKGDVELPSDISGVLYLDLEDGEWKLNLARKLKKAGLPVHGDALISVEDHPRG